MFVQIRNWWVPYLYRLHVYTGSQTIIFRDGDKLQIDEHISLAIPSFARLKRSRGVRVANSVDGVRLSFAEGAIFDLRSAGIFWEVGVLNETWDWDEYRLNGRDLKGKTVVDVGGFIGDSALRFASLGAIVHVFEPFPPAINALKKNIKLSSHIGHRVHLHPVALCCQNSTGSVPYNPFQGSFARTDSGAAGPRTEEIHFVNADDYFMQVGISYVDILKMDCEGCEYELICKSRLLEILRPEEIVLEFHSGPKGLPERLEQLGYSVNFEQSTGLGLLFATRIVQQASRPDYGELRSGVI